MEQLESQMEIFAENIRQLNIIATDFQPQTGQPVLNQKINQVVNSLRDIDKLKDTIQSAVAAAQHQHGVVHHQSANNTQTSAMAALNHTGWSPSIGSMAPSAHHAVLTDQSPPAYTTHAYQSHNMTVGDHHRNSNGPMSTQAVGASPQASSYAVDNLYNAPAAAAAAAAAAACGYDNYNTAFSQPPNNSPQPQSGHPSSAACFTLLKIYLNYFVPLENASRNSDGSNFTSTAGIQQGSLWQSLSSTTTSILNLASNNTQTASNMNSQGGHILPSLFKASILQPQTPFNQNLTSTYMSTPRPILYGQGEHLGSIEWRCSTFLLVLTELLFGNIPAPKTNYILRPANSDDLSISDIQPYSANIGQMAAVRVVIKHLHSFSNSFTYNTVNHATNQGLAEIKQAIWTSKYPFQKRLYTFIKIAFNRWPMDYTFRQPLEAWLSYIQPWRYVKVNNEYNSDFEDLDTNRGTSLIDVPSIDNHWRNFISDNLLYYSVIFTLLIDRLLQLDLSSSRNAFMLFRVVKVYSQSGFMSILREAEEVAMRNNIEQTMNSSASKSAYKISTPGRNADASASKAKLLAPSFLASGRVSTPKTRIGALEHHLINLESDSEFDYVSLFSPQMKQQLSKLLTAVQNSRLSIKEFVQSVEVRSKLRNRGWFDSIRSFLSLEDACFESKDEREMYKDKLLAEDYLNFATNKIAQCFDIQVPELDLHLRTGTKSTNSQTPKIFFNY